MIVTVAPAMALLEASTTEPDIVPVTVWAMANTLASNRQNRPCNKFDQLNLMEDIRTSSLMDWSGRNRGFGRILRILTDNPRRSAASVKIRGSSCPNVARFGFSRGK